MPIRSLETLPSVCESWSLKIWRKLKKSFRDARAKAVSRGMRHWTSATANRHMGQPASTTSSDLEISSMIESVLELYIEGNSDRSLLAVPCVCLAFLPRVQVAPLNSPSERELLTIQRKELEVRELGVQ